MIYEPLGVKNYKTEHELRTSYNKIHRNFFRPAIHRIVRQAEKDKDVVVALRDHVEKQLTEIQSLIDRAAHYQTEIDNLREFILDKKIEAARLREARKRTGIATKEEATTYNFQRVLAAISVVYCVSAKDIKSESRTRQLAAARRHLVHILCTHRQDLSLPLIGRLLGGRDHSTILHARNSWPAVEHMFSHQIAEVNRILGAAVDSGHNLSFSRQHTDHLCTDGLS